MESEFSEVAVSMYHNIAFVRVCHNIVVVVAVVTWRALSYGDIMYSVSHLGMANVLGDSSLTPEQFDYLTTIQESADSLLQVFPLFVYSFVRLFVCSFVRLSGCCAFFFTTTRVVGFE